MKRESTGPMLSAVFVDYDNIYLSLKRKSDEAAKRFAKDANVWLKAIETGRLITPTNSFAAPDDRRRMVMNRCYGNPVPRRNTTDNSTDMSSFPFVRHHFLRAGFEVVDCPPLTAQLKNSSDIRMVMDVRDFLTHETYFDEFVILSGDADFTPVLHRLRAHARRTIIFANDYTAAPYTAISDGEVREVDLVRLLLDGRLGETATPAQPLVAASPPSLESLRADIIAEVAGLVRAAGQAVPLEVLAERTVRALGHDRTVASGWAGAGSFRELLQQALPPDIRLTGEPPYMAYPAELAMQRAPARLPEPAREAPVRDLAPAEPAASIAPSARPVPQPAPPAATYPAPAPTPPRPPARDLMPLEPQLPPLPPAPPRRDELVPPPAQRALPSSRPPLERPAAAPLPPPAPPPMASLQASPSQPSPTRAQRPPMLETMPAPRPPSPPPPAAVRPSPPAAPQRAAAGANALQQAIARIQEACQAPPLSPPEYRALFDLMARELNENGLQGAQTLAGVQTRASQAGIQLTLDDVRFVLDVVSETDPWLEQGASANLFAGRFRNFVVARCRSQGLSLSVEDLDLIEAWFAGGPAPVAPQQRAVPPPVAERMAQAVPPTATGAAHAEAGTESWWSSEPRRQTAAPPAQYAATDPRPATAAEFESDEFPRIVRTRVRG
jgi:hypothetical protein